MSGNYCSLRDATYNGICTCGYYHFPKGIPSYKTSHPKVPWGRIKKQLKLEDKAKKRPSNPIGRDKGLKNLQV